MDLGCGSGEFYEFVKKLENEVIAEPATNSLSSEMLSEQTAINQEVESITENNCSSNYEQSFTEEVQKSTNEVEENVSNGLENFGVEGETAPDLFTSDTETTESEGLLTSENTKNNHEDEDLEIPAFLRRQKN